MSFKVTSGNGFKGFKARGKPSGLLQGLGLQIPGADGFENNTRVPGETPETSACPTQRHVLLSRSFAPAARGPAPGTALFHEWRHLDTRTSSQHAEKHVLTRKPMLGAKMWDNAGRRSARRCRDAGRTAEERTETPN